MKIPQKKYKMNFKMIFFTFLMFYDLKKCLFQISNYNDHYVKRCGTYFSPSKIWSVKEIENNKQNLKQLSITGL